jgi:hypothetical protein
MKFYSAILLSFLFFVFNNSYSQIKTDEGYVVEMVIYQGDTIPKIELAPVLIMPKKTFKNRREKIRFLRLVRKVKKVLPYAQLANQKLREIEVQLQGIDDKRIRRKYIKQVDKALKDQYGEELKKLTISEGRILIKLIDRETGATSYELIEELRGSLSAFMWQSLARLFGENLKEDYDPEGEDRLIEEIVLRIQAGQY